MMISILLAATLHAPEATERAVRTLMHRTRVSEEEEIAAARVLLWIAPDGKVLECQLSHWSGSEDTAKELCNDAVGLRFDPAEDEIGNAVHSLYSTTLSAFPYGYRSVADRHEGRISGRSTPPDLVVALSELPAELAWDPRVTVNLMIDDAGTSRHCEPAQGNDARWAEIACSQMVSRPMEVRRSKDHAPVAYFQNFAVKFIAAE